MPKWLPYAALAALTVLAIGRYWRTETPGIAAPPETPAIVSAADPAGAPAAGAGAGAKHPHSQAGSRGHAHWSYEGPEGPEHWGELDPAYAACARGTHQTPIDIHDAVDADLPALAIDYRTLGYEVVNNGHTIQVNVAPGSSLTLDGVSYELKQLHFHTPSENEVDERHYAMEAHLVHGDKDGHLAVIGVLYREGPEDSAIARVWSESPKSTGPARTLSAPVDPNTLLPKGRNYYTFEGSLTTPPCTEGVKWIVLKEPLTVSKEEVAFLEQAMHGHNSRPVQALHARAVLR